MSEIEKAPLQIKKDSNCVIMTLIASVHLIRVFIAYTMLTKTFPEIKISEKIFLIRTF